MGQAAGQVTDGVLEGCLDRSHQAVVRNDLVRAVVAHRDEHAAIGHQRLRQLCHAHKGVAGDVHRGQEALDRAVDQVPLQIRLGGEGERVNQEIETPPFLADCREDGRHLRRLAHLQRQGQLGAVRAGERLDIGSRLLVEVGYRKARAGIAQSTGAAVGDRLIVGDAGNEPDFAASTWDWVSGI